MNEFVAHTFLLMLVACLIGFGLGLLAGHMNGWNTGYNEAWDEIDELPHMTYDTNPPTGFCVRPSDTAYVNYTTQPTQPKETNND